MCIINHQDGVLALCDPGKIGQCSSMSGHDLRKTTLEFVSFILGAEIGGDDVGVGGVDLANQPLPEMDRLGVGVIDAKGLHTLLHPAQRPGIA